MASVLGKPFLCVAAVVACAVACCAGTVIVPAGDVDALTNALKTASAYDTVRLSAGTYDLSPLANAPMANADGDGYGAALLSLGVAGLHLMGATGDPKDVILEATDSECRLLLISYNSCKVSGLTLSGGNAAAAHITKSDKYKRGGGVFICGNNTIVSNCVFTGNRAHLDGGAVATVGDAPKQGSKVLNCSVVTNAAGRHGGGLFNVELVENCTVVGNTAGQNGGGVANCGLVKDTSMAHNRAQKGGGAYGCTLAGCAFEANAADIGADRFQCGHEHVGMRIVLTGGIDMPELDTIYTVPHELDCLVESGHIQGACCSDKAIYLSHSLGIDKIGWDGKLVKHVDVPAHLGDSAYADGLIYGACDIKDASLRVDGKPGLVRVWNEDLEVVTNVWFNESLDGITVLGDTIYVGVAAAGAPHGTNIVKRLGRDLSDKGNVELDFGYWTKYGVQTMATDGSSIFFGNYGADVDTGNPEGWNGTRLSPSLEIMGNLKFPKPNGVSEGFDFVPKSVSRRSDPVFLRVGAATSQKEWNTTDHPPQIRIQFFSCRDDSFTLITK